MNSAAKYCSLLLTVLSLFTSTARSFTFAYGPPTQCDPFTVSWTGGTAPFSLLLTPVFDNPRNFTIPSESSGSFTVPQLPLPAGKQFIISMSDATGFGSGGVSDILTVGSSVSRSSCSTDIPTPGFQFQLDSPLMQCTPYNISGYTQATQPVTITGLIPLGKPLQLHPNPGPPWFVWDSVNVPTDTTIVFFLTDAAGHLGGSSRALPVGNSGNSACINGQSPMSTANSASGGPTATVPAGSPSSTDGAPAATVTVAPKGVGSATIGGAVAGGLVALLILGSLTVFFFRTYLPSKRGGSRNRLSHTFSVGSRRHGRDPSIDLLQPNSANPLNRAPPNPFNAQSAPQAQWTTFPATPGNDYLARPYVMPSPSNRDYFSSSTAATENGWYDSRSDVAPHSMPTEPSPSHPGRSSKSSMGPPSQRPTRFILHTDAEEEEEDDQVELPPQYADRTGRTNGHPLPL